MTAADAAYCRLHRCGWTIGDTAFSRPPGVAWLVYGHNGDNLIRAEGRTRDGVWQRAVEQARGWDARVTIRPRTLLCADRPA